MVIAWLKFMGLRHFISNNFIPEQILQLGLTRKMRHEIRNFINLDSLRKRIGK